MLQPMRTHILYLEDLLQDFRASLRKAPLTSQERAAIETKISLISRAMEHYRLALELEYTLRKGEETAHNSTPVGS